MGSERTEHVRRDLTTRSRRRLRLGAKSPNLARMRRVASEPPFERVWRVVRAIPRGRVATYGAIAELIEGRLTPVGVGWAIRAAPEGLLPWHRVVNAAGRVSTDREHPGLQRAMLEKEGVRFSAEGEIDLERYGWRPRGRGGAASAGAGARARRKGGRREGGRN
jgi:methylated-DNA-protein-cysteine methyltransferase-like protein